LHKHRALLFFFIQKFYVKHAFNYITSETSFLIKKILCDATLFLRYKLLIAAVPNKIGAVNLEISRSVLKMIILLLVLRAR